MTVDTDDTADVTPTVTLARLYEAQGFLDKATAVYRRLVASGQADLMETLKDVERRSRIGKAGQSDTETILSRLSEWQRAINTRKTDLNERCEKERKALVIYGSMGNDNDNESGPSFPGDVTPDEIDREIRTAAQQCGLKVDTFQSSHEVELTQKIRESSDGYDVVIINTGEHGRTSTAIRDALLMLDIPIIEVRLFNNCGQGPSGQKSLIADVVTAHLAGFGKDGYVMAIQAAKNMSEATVEAGASRFQKAEVLRQSEVPR